MKIISEGNGVYIVSVGKDELANLLGYYWARADGYQPPKEGQEVNISGMYAHLRTHKELHSRLKKSADMLREFADAMEKIPVPIKSGD